MRIVSKECKLPVALQNGRHWHKQTRSDQVGGGASGRLRNAGIGPGALARVALVVKQVER